MSDGSPSPPSDTHPKIHALLIEGYRKLSPSQKFEQVCALTRTVQQLALLDIRRRHPNAREQALRVASRWIEPEVEFPRKSGHRGYAASAASSRRCRCSYSIGLT